MKRCSLCKTEKSRDEFYKRAKSVDGHAPLCKPCDKDRSRRWRLANPERAKRPYRNTPARRAWRIKNAERVRSFQRKNSGIPEPAYPAPVGCECCGGPPTGKGVLCVDHCHETNKFRGWLCDRCNVGIGMLRDNEAGVLAALAYLRKPR